MQSAAARPIRALFFVALFVSTTTIAARADELALTVLSNRADLVSDGDALVEVVVPPDVAAGDVHVTLNAADVTAAFGLDAGGRFLGLVDGLVLGDNVLEAYVTPPTLKQAAAIVISNHPIGGPIFSGAQLLPFICARKTATPVVVTVPGTTLSGMATTKVSGLDFDPIDDQCNAASKITLYYQPKALEGGSCTFTTPLSGGSCFSTVYNLGSPPADADVANFTNDRGDVVKSIIVVERGTVDRGLYDIVSFYNPNLPNTAQDRQRGWNGKLLWGFGAASGPRRFEMAPTVSVFNANALSRGFMVASGSLTDHDTNSNDTLAAEFLMMIKEHIIESYGEVRYTIGAGCSGGSILQYNIAAAYPGLLDGIQPNCTFPDTLTTAIEVTDCGLLGRHYGQMPGSTLSTAKRAAINGHANANQCVAWVAGFLPFGNPSSAANCGGGFPTSITYDPTLRGDGVRCTSFDHDASMLGTFVDVDGNRKAQSPLDNVGVQYGLKALTSGVISAEEFVALNENVGSYTPDLVWVHPQRSVGNPFALDTAYTAGLVSDGKQLAKTAIIDLRGQQGTIDIHLNWRAWEVRSRLDKANGNHDNQVIWASGGGITPGAALLLRSFVTMDAWLHNIELDGSNTPIETKIVANKPADAHDMCIVANGANEAQIVDVGLGTPSCPVTFQSSPHQVAGGPQSEDIFKCQLKALDFGSADYNGVAFSGPQQARLAVVFPSGVCDWTLAGVSQAPSDGGSTFKNGPGGEPLGPPPASDVVDPVCGDGDVIGEVCDDGNTSSSDGCSATCTVETGFTCTGSPSVCTPICGDGLKRGGEVCDDGNTSSNDGCSATCTVETGYACPGEPSVCAGICGDGLVRGSEGCDDGDLSAGDGCSASCTVEAGFSCPGEPSACVAICGDGLVRASEACDDGNLSASDGCSATCTVEGGFNCTGEPSACDGICGDGLIRGTEACDDAAGNGSLPSCCAVTCQLKAGGSACNDGNACTTNDTCSGAANVCNGGAPPNCDDLNSCTVDSCDTGLGCQHDGPARNGFACDDGSVCTQNDVCAGGICSGPTGADTDADGYCDMQETTTGCNPNDGNEIPPQAVVFGGKPLNGNGNLLVSYLTPTNDKVLLTPVVDPSCATTGVCGGNGFCTAGKIADHCTTAADCNQPAGTCRIVANYAETPDLAVRRPFKFNKTDVTAAFLPLTPGCSRKVDLTLDPAFKTNRLKLNVTGTAGGRVRRDADSFRWR